MAWNRQAVDQVRFLLASAQRLEAMADQREAELLHGNVDGFWHSVDRVDSCRAFAERQRRRAAQIAANPQQLWQEAAAGRRWPPVPRGDIGHG